ncbi:integrase arm-type DNA-binding domain-containing protein [Methylonatrum kenyense]|uniref:tyrosine-type recombinase/integrase n=1 Tax=Methylonatrum kenyense TaxID=455253 RepID=UPI0020BFE651|nr:integrase arm-type DNA-binding domain-containing protein [Methylonatrum kenyense]MCK8514884.1 integrase arm-type DNA-binding domain-containing protein [Methylonatrum kenyense]
MPKVARELSATDVRNMNTPGYHAVGGVSGLYLQVTKNGGKTWILRAMVGSKRRDIGLGGFPTVPLTDARKKAREMRDMIARGVDPVVERKAAQDALKAAQEQFLTFEAAARRYHKIKAPEFKSEKHRQDWIKSLEMYAFPYVGERSVAEMTKKDVLEVLEPIWNEKTETATRVRQRMDLVFSWAIASDYRTADNPARWKDNLEHKLAKPSAITKVAHHRALPWKDVPAFVVDLRTRDGIGARALEFAILTAARSGEVRKATWDEINLEEKLWTLPEHRMKAGKQHKVPLSTAAIDILRSMPRTSDYVFPNTKGGPISDMTMSAVCRRMGVDAVPHGFRSSFKDWARHYTFRDSEGFPHRFDDEVSELALAHVNSDATRAAYARDELLPQRREMMNYWSEFLDAKEPNHRADNVVPFQ